MDAYTIVQCSVFQGSDSLFEGRDNLSYFMNKDSTGCYVFSMAQGLNPIAKWVRRDRASVRTKNFQASYTADIIYAGDRINGYKIEHGLYVDLGTGTLQARAAESAAAPAAAAAAAPAVVGIAAE